MNTESQSNFAAPEASAVQAHTPGAIAELSITLTNDEAAFVLNELHSAGHGHGSSVDDFEPECPSCTAADKINAVVRAAIEAATGETK